MNMKTLIAIFMLAGLVVVSGCWSTQESTQGGIAPVNEEFSITVPSTTTIKQGEQAAITVTLNRGAFFKRDVQLDLKADGIAILPTEILVKASDKPDVKVQLTVAKIAAIGDYRVSVTGTPSSGKAASTVFIVKVIAQ